MDADAECLKDIDGGVDNLCWMLATFLCLVVIIIVTWETFDLKNTVMSHVFPSKNTV